MQARWPNLMAYLSSPTSAKAKLIIRQKTETSKIAVVSSSDCIISLVKRQILCMRQSRLDSYIAASSDQTAMASTKCLNPTKQSHKQCIVWEFPGKSSALRATLGRSLIRERRKRTEAIAEDISLFWINGKDGRLDSWPSLLRWLPRLCHTLWFSLFCSLSAWVHISHSQWTISPWLSAFPPNISFLRDAMG